MTDEVQDDIRMLRDSARDFLVGSGGVGRARALRFSEPGHALSVWQTMCDMGWPGAHLPVDQGGSGLGVQACIALSQEMGRVLAPEPLSAYMLAATLLDPARRAELLAGSLRVATAWRGPSPLPDRDSGVQWAGNKISGVKKSVIGALDVHGFIITTNDGLAYVQRDAPGVSVEAIGTQDGGYLANLTLEATPAERLPDEFPAAFEQAVLANAAYLLGVMQEAFEMTLRYLRERRQFDRPIGSFQALQHRAAELHVGIALTQASIQHAAAVLDDPSSTLQARQGAVSRAKARASDHALLVTRQAVQMHGAIGYTDEYDVGLYLRSALTHMNAYGSAAAHRARFGALMQDHGMASALHQDSSGGSPSLTATGAAAQAVDSDPSVDDYNDMCDESFRQLVRTWIEKNYPEHIRNPAKRLHRRDNKVWYDKLAQRGWLAPNWPRSHGGMGLGATKLIIMHEELERYGCARLNDMGMTYLGPLLIGFGTPQQQSYYLPRILRGEHIWCQGYSEPNAGSDLASLRTSAVLDGNEWVVNGQKIWTTLASDANWIFLLVRTHNEGRKQGGISFLLVPLDTPGITVRPIINLDMHDEFCEVFFDDVRVPCQNLVGQVNQGWTIAKALLGHERIFLGSPKQAAYALDRLLAVGNRNGTLSKAGMQDRYVRFKMDLDDHAALYEQFVDLLKQGRTLGPDVSMLKLHQSELFQRITEMTLELSEESSGLIEPIPGEERLHPAGLFIQARQVTIAGGSSEVQRDIIAKHVLGLPSA